jgi:undecaprenyl diphosphate synthase
MLKSLEGFLAPGSEEAHLAEAIDYKRLPGHIAIIMDGNGRWAKRRGLSRAEGHRAGAKAVREAIETAVRVELPVLTLYAFSKENWRRPRPEVLTLWRLLVEYLRKEEKLLVDNRIRLRALGQKDGLPPKVRRELERVEEATRSFGGLQLCVALNYGGRAEIVDAARDILRRGEIAPESLTEEVFARHLYLPEIPDPDLLIRTSGEFRVSNFLLWQIAYAEIWITPDFWPDFNRRHLLQAIVDFQKRERRFGDVQARS